MSSRASRGLHVCATVVALELAVALSYVFVLVSTSVDTGDLEVLPGILVIGLIFGLLVGLGPGLSTSTRPNRLGLRRPRFRHFAFGLAAGTTVGLFIGVSAGIGAALAVGTSVGALLGLIFWLVDDPMPTVGRQAPIADDYIAGLAVALGLMLVGCGIPTFASLFAGEALVPSLVGYLVLAIPLGTIVFLTLAQAGVRYTCGCVALAARKTFPLRALHFMKWARDAGLLRMTGTTYQFRHETFRDWILNHPISAVSISDRVASAPDADPS